MDQEIFIHWTTEQEVSPHSNDRQLVIGLVGFGLVLLALGLNNILFALIVAIGVVTLIIIKRRPGKNTAYAIGREGLLIGNRFYPYETLESFWVHKKEGQSKITVRSSKTLMPHLVLPLHPDHNEEEFRELLLAFLEEARHDESLIEAVSDFIVS